MPGGKGERGAGSKSGETRRQRNERFNQAHLNPEPPEPPVGAEHVWLWFWELSKRRRSGPEAISYAEIGEWTRVTGTLVAPEEVAMLIAMDDAYLKAIGEDRRAAREYEQAQSKSTGKGGGNPAGKRASPKRKA